MRTGRPRTVDRYARKREQVFTAVDRICLEQQRRILTRFHGDPTNRGPWLSNFAPDPQPGDLLEGEPVERLWGQQRLMRLGPALHHRADPVEFAMRGLRSTTASIDHRPLNDLGIA
jgi:hypothetical protein